jgi:uncharacterized protein
MLYRITIENFFSIADTQEISFAVHGSAPDVPCFRGARFDENIRLPVSVGFFGSNASGKTTILRAIMCSFWFALHSFDGSTAMLFQAYRQKNWWEKPSKILIEFDSQMSDEAAPAKFRYELHISHAANDLSNKTVSYEALSYAPKGKFRRLFERKGQTFYFGQEFGISFANDPRKESIRSDASVLSTLAKLNHPQSIYLSQQINMLQTNFAGFNGRSAQRNDMSWLSIYAKDKACLERLNRELRRFDVGLESMSVEQGDQGFFAKLKHVGLDSFVFFGEESAGTQRFIEIFPRLHYALELGGLAVIDELDTDFHPLLLPELFRWFSDPSRNPRGAQLLFTAHNPALLDNLEKEQIFFVEKPSGQPTHIYGARDIKGLRRDLSLMRKYLSGELGAVPHIG